MKTFVKLALIVGLLCGTWMFGIALAEEIVLPPVVDRIPEAAPAVVVDAEESSGWEHWTLKIELIWKAIAVIGTALLTLVMKISIGRMAKTDAEKEALAAVEQAVVEVYQGYVSALKKKASDGKLTKEEAAEARRMATAKALAIAKGPALKLMTDWGQPRVEALIERVVAKFKG